MKVSVRKVANSADEQVVLECVEMTKDFKDIKEYAESRGKLLQVYRNGNEMHQINRDEILYAEAVGELVFVYTQDDVYEVKMRLYELEEKMQKDKLIRCSKSNLINLRKIISVRPALNGRFLARMENGEDVIISRQYSKMVKKSIMEDL